MPEDRTPPPCDNCGHAYGKHTGRSLGYPPEKRWPGSRVGPKEVRWGSMCEVEIDWHHTCACPRYFLKKS